MGEKGNVYNYGEGKERGRWNLAPQVRTSQIYSASGIVKAAK